MSVFAFLNRTGAFKKEAEIKSGILQTAFIQDANGEKREETALFPAEGGLYIHPENQAKAPWRIAILRWQWGLQAALHGHMPITSKAEGQRHCWCPLP